MATEIQTLADAESGAAKAYLFTLTREDGFELPEYIATVGDFGGYLRSRLRDTWRLKMSGLWYHAIPDESQLPTAGFKLHVSSTLANATQTIDAVVPVCVRHGCRFKILRGENLLCLANSKSFPREAAHKFFTVYPVNRQQFQMIASELKSACAGLNGPRVLSDRAVGDSQAVFYRYGGFKPVERLLISGHKQLLIPGSDGQPVLDRRRPFFTLPEGITDPFDDHGSTVLAGRPVLNRRYQISDALTFSTCGGTYLATDTDTGEEVVVKEARPLTRLSSNIAVTFSRTESLKREADILELLQGLTGVPRLLNTFEEAGHLFVVQSKLGGQRLREYRASDHLLLLPFDSGVDTGPFERFFRRCARNLIASVQAIHRRRVILGDISSGNVLVTEAGEVALLDFESAWSMAWGDRPDAIASTWMTPGYRRPERGALDPSSYRDDWFGVGMILFGMLLPVERQIMFNPEAAQTFMAAIMRATGLGAWVGECMRELWRGRPGRALQALDTLQLSASAGAIRPRPGACVNGEGDSPWRSALPQIRDHLRARFDASRSDRLWPCDFESFLTSPFNLGFGAGGAVMALSDPADPIPASIRSVLAETKPDPKRCAPGLWNGMAGIALWKYRHVDRTQGLACIDAALSSALSRQDPGYFFGMSGIGLACLQLFHWSGEQRLLDSALEIGNTLVEQVQAEKDGPVWARHDGSKLPTGLAHGASGIALFLLQLAQIPGRGAFEHWARAALQQDLSRRSSAYPEDRPRWTYPGRDTLWSPYWMEGGCGIGAVVARFYHHLRDPGYRELACNIAEANYSRFTVMPGQFEGVAGIGEFMLDLATLCDCKQYRARAEDIARSILIYGVSKDDGLAFPGRHLMKLSCCYGYGAAGIALFFQRLQFGGGRFLHDMV